MGTPPAGVSESPLMTWGEVENTPLRVEGSDTPYVDRTPGPAFKVGRHGGGHTGGHRVCCAPMADGAYGRAGAVFLVGSGPPPRTAMGEAWVGWGDGGGELPWPL